MSPAEGPTMSHVRDKVREVMKLVGLREEEAEEQPKETEEECGASSDPLSEAV